MKTLTLTVPAIHCSHCTHTIEMEVGEIPGVQSVRADLAAKQVTVAFGAPANEDKIRTLLAEIEYPAAA
jgi:copper chaperone CopZ